MDLSASRQTDVFSRIVSKKRSVSNIAGREEDRAGNGGRCKVEKKDGRK